MDNNNNNNQIENANQNENENEMKNLEKKVTKNLIKNYSNLLNGNSFKDFSIFVENKSNPFEIKVHKSILSSRSPFFDKFLRGQNDIDKIFLKQFNKKEMESILSYIYYGNISFENQENLIQLLEISIYFKLNLLKEIIQKKILNSINYSNFFQFLFQNRNLNLNEIEIKCFELINQNFSQIQNNENLFNLTKEEIIKFIQFKQEKKEIFQFDFFQFLNNWIEKRVNSLKLRKYKHKMNAKKRLFHSFFSLFDKDSISKQDFDKLKQFDFFLPNSFLVDIQNKVIQDNQKEIENKEKENQQMKIEIEDKNKEIEKNQKEIEKNQKEIEDKNKEIEKNQKEIEDKEKENQQMKIEIEEKWKKEVEDMKPIFDKYRDQYQKDLEYEKKMKEFGKAFSDSEIIKDIEYVKKLQEWINDNDFFSKMKKGFSANRDGFNSKKWHKKVDGKGKTLVIIKTKDNFIFGGFTQVGFNGNKGNINDSNAFIFSLRNDKGDRIPAKFTIKQGQEQNAIHSHLDHGPVFGSDGTDFRLSSNLQPGLSQFGSRYNLPNGITYNTNEAQNYIIERKEKQYKFPKLILIIRSELYRGMFLSVTEDKSNKVTDYSELSNKSFQIFEYWIYSNQIKDEIEITQEIINEIKIGIDYFQLNQKSKFI
ncbi:pep-cterm sorting domain-containing protein [Anaeramoeba ignava]|uniref:Pep-cterm sorting domain-containing protein n=1 Tax=Anaeramoeba ignava TaxID=1746090 RepID=A0A9Q0LDF9_ANAIG|nr:pep-cterm sorting domain-containing protein [Anaeramoeba ignava]